MPLTLVVGPANAGKVSCLLDRYLARLPREPVLIVPNRSDVERAERDLLKRQPCLLGGSIGTFDDLFARIADGLDERRPVAGDAQRRLVARRAVAGAELNGLSASARHAGFTDALLAVVGELESGLVEPAGLDGDLARLYAAYRAELDRLGLWDRDLLRARAAARLANDLDAWDGAPVFAYGFEDLTAAEWTLVEALAGRAEVTVSVPYEPARPAFAALRPTVEDLARLAGPRIEELPPRYAEVAQPAIAYLERGLFSDRPPATAEIDGAIRFFEGAGARGALELVGEEVLSLLRSGTAPERVALIVPSVERWRAALETAFGSLGIPFAVEGPVRLAQTPFGGALVSLLRAAWLGGGRGELFAFLRSPYSGLARSHVDFLEGRLRGRGIESPERIEAEVESLRGAPLRPLELARGAPPVEAVAALAESMLAAAYGRDRPPVGEDAERDLRAHESCTRLVAELRDWEARSEPLAPDDVVAALDRATVQGPSPGSPGRVAVLDLLRARTRRPEVAFVLGLEEGSLPRRGDASPFLDEDARRRLGGRLTRPDAVSRDRYLFYTACARPTRRLYLVREAATDDGTPREPSPFWEEVQALFDADDVARWTRRRPLSALSWALERAPTERERLRAVAQLAADEQEVETAEALSRANGWLRRLDRARNAFTRETRLRHPLVLEQLRERSVFNVTELERFADCSSAWLFDRVVDPKTIDAEVDPKLRGSVAHSTLFRFFSGLPKELGADRVEPERVEDAVRFLRRCLESAIDGVRMEMTPVARRELEQGLLRDLEASIRDEAAHPLPLAPRRFEVSFGSERSPPELQRGLELGEGVVLSGKIDRIDVDPFSARGIVQDYKAGKTAHSARDIERELRLQIPLYMLVLRDLVGIEPLGGVYRPLAGDRKPRGLLRAEDAVPGFQRNDYLDDDAFWAQVEGAREAAGGLATRIRRGDVRHDPRGGECPAWCDLWPMCRKARA